MNQRGGVFIDYEILINKENKIEESYVKSYVIPNLVKIDSVKNNDFLYKTFGIKEKANFLEKRTAENFEKLKNYAKNQGIILGVTSGYLSFKQQQTKYDYFAEKRGIEFAQKSACLPGYSEHNTGLCLDCDIFLNGKWAGIAPDKNENINHQTAWLHNVLHKFGFILRYPRGKEEITKMKFEPWHIRYVGEKTAKYIYENNLTLEEYHDLKNK
ncbi:MAG: M15 family metallopeptidase [Clostridia bacterium]|nr:M15 family metallopeptidase [Clostridia bacterium]